MTNRRSCNHTAADHEYKTAIRNRLPLGQRAAYVRRISDDYLLELIANHQTEGSKPTLAIYEAELTLRGDRVARRAEWLAWIALIVSGASLAVGVVQAI